MKYIFLSYINRSGSTFLVNQFSKLNIFCVCPEADILYDLLLRNPLRIRSFKRRYVNQFLNDEKLVLWQLDPEKVTRILLSRISHGEKFLKILELFRDTHYPISKYILFKYNFIIRLKSYFEKRNSSDTFHWIYLYRNPLSVYASQRQTVSPTTSKPMATNSFAFCNKVKSLDSACNKAGPEKYLKISYDDLILNFNSTFGILCDFLDVNIPCAKYNSSPGKLRPFLSEEFNSLHPKIDSPPDIHRLTVLVSTLSDYEIYIICKKLNLEAPREKPKLRFKIQFIFPYISDSIKSYFTTTRDMILERV